jgi:tetratricopeptide (TPR) repeat protein
VPIFGFLFYTAWLYVYFKQRNRVKALKIYFIALLVVAVSFVYISYNRTKIWQSTVTLFEDVIKKQPRFTEGYDKLSEHYEIGRDYRNALKWAKITLTKRNNNPGTYLRMVRCHLALNEPDSAMIYAPYAVRSVANLQQLMEASSMKGYLDMRAGKYADAVVDYDQILHYNPNSAPDLLQRAQAKAAMQQYALALADVEHVLQVNPEYPDAYFIRGRLRFTLEQRAAACADFNKAHSLGQQDAAEWLQLYCR